jgi:ribosome-associated protein
MDIRKLQRAIIDGLENVKAQHIAIFNTEHLSALFERVIIASGTSNRQTKALAASVRDAVKARGMQVLRTEGEDNGEWIIVDCGAAVAHIMQPSIRDYYNLEEIWGGKPVNMKMGAAAPASAKRAGATKGAVSGDTTRAEPARAVAGRLEPGQQAAAKKPVTRTATAKKAAAQRAPSRGAPVKTAAAKKAPAKRAPAKQVSAKTPQASRAFTRKAPVAAKKTSRS